MSLFPWQYAAAANCSKCWRFAKRPESIAIVDRQQTRHDTDLKGLSKSKPLVWGVTGFALRKGAKNTGAVTQKNATVRGMMSIEIMDWDEGIGDSKQRKERKKYRTLYIQSTCHGLGRLSVARARLKNVSKVSVAAAHINQRTCCKFRLVLPGLVTARKRSSSLLVSGIIVAQR